MTVENGSRHEPEAIPPESAAAGVAGGTARKRGEKLLETVYDATKELIREEGYTALTFAKIARRAHTSRTVLYSRWGTILTLVHDIMSYKSAQSLGGSLTDKLVDTGSLRGDFLHLLSLYVRIYRAVGPEVINAMLFEVSRNTDQVQELKDNVGLQNTESMETILAFAQARGDHVRAVSAMVQRLPFDLIRICYMWGRTPLDRVDLEQIVDDILVPVFLQEN